MLASTFKRGSFKEALYCRKQVQKRGNYWDGAELIIKQRQQTHSIQQPVGFQMSDLVEGSDSMSMDQNIQVHANHEGENQIFIPFWEEEGSSSTYLNHLREEVRILKSKCTHLENHLEENHREFNSLNQLYLIAQTNEKKLLRENDQLKKRYKEASQELLQIRVQLQNAVAEVSLSSKKDLEWRESSKKKRQQQFQLEERVRVLEQENQMLRKRAVSVSDGEEGKWKQMVDEQSKLAEARLQRQNEHFSFQHDILQRDLETVNQTLRTVQTNFKSYKEETRLFREKVNSEREEALEKENKAIASQSALEKQERELKASCERTRSEREQLEEENKILRRQLAEQAHRLATQHKINQEKQLKYKESQQEVEEKNIEIKDLNDSVGKNKAKSNLQEKEINDLKSQLEESRQNVEYVERQRRDCREEIESVRRAKDLEIQRTREEYEGRVRELKSGFDEERNKKIQKITTLENEVQFLKCQVVNQDNVLRPVNVQVSFQIVAKQLEMARNRISELEQLSLLSSDCGHFDQIKKNQQQLRRIKKDKQNLELLIEDQKLSLESVHQETVKIREVNRKLEEQLRKMESQYHESVASKERLQKELQRASDNERQSTKRTLASRLSGEVPEGIPKLERQLRQKQSECISLRKLLESVQQELKTLNNEDKEGVSGEAQMTEKENKILMLQSSLGELRGIHLQRVIQLERSLMEKDNRIALQEIRVEDKTREVREWEAKYKTVITDLQLQEDLVSKMKSEIKELNQKSVPVADEREELADPSQKIERELKNKNIFKLQMAAGEEQTLQDLEEEYQRELTALKRLVEYRTGKEESRNAEEIRRQSSMEIQGLLVDYRIMQEQMIKLRETVLGSHEMRGMREQNSLLIEKEILIEKVDMWERKYEELRCLFEAKLSSKEETINLLTLKIGNMQMARRCACCFI